jgi:membrane fusion protein (multidrug efflux system)
MRWIRSTKLYLIAGVVILTASLLGAHYIQNPNREPQRGNGQRNSAARGTNTVHCIGIMSPEGEIIPLVPSGQGEVVEVFVKQDQQVKKGDKLLRLDDRLAKAKFDEAEAGVDVAEGLLTEAQQALTIFEGTREAQQEVINAKELMRQAAEEDMVNAKKLAEADSREALKFKTAQMKIDALKKEINAEKIRLRTIEQGKPTSKVTQAKAGVKRAKSLRDQAQLGLDACLMTAPADGTITQSFVGVGSKFGGQVQKPAFLFYSGGLSVRAEIEQDYANNVKEGQSAEVEDYSNPNQRWRGRVTKVAGSFQAKRDASAIPNFIQEGNQERVKECRITLENGESMPILNQKLRVHIAPK